MPRKPRLHVPAAFYHVTLRGNHRQDTFFSPKDRDILDEIVAEITQRFGARLHAYCWMTNHLHLLIQVGDTPLGRIMLRIASRYARVLQARFHTTGHLFERRYHAVLVDAESYLLELVRYIHLNPVRAGMVTTPDAYPWSSHLVYMGHREQAWGTTEFSLSMFHTERQQAIEGYSRFIQQNATLIQSPLQHCNPDDQRILGCDTFARSILGNAWQPRSQKSIDQLIDEACARFTVTRHALLSTSRQRNLSRARAWIAYQAITQRISSVAGVAAALSRDESTLRESVKLHFNYP